MEREGEKSQLRNERIDPVGDNVSILLIGVDNSADRNYSHSRSDALIVAVFNKPTNSINLLSIPIYMYQSLVITRKLTMLNSTAGLNLRWKQ